MANWSRPWANTTPGDAGPYSDGQWADLYNVLFGGNENKRGVLVSTENDSLTVSEKSGTPDMSVDITPGAAMVDGRVFYENSTRNATIAAADPSLNRIDYVVVRSDATNQDIDLYVKTGTAAASPVPPTLDTSGSPYFEIPLAQVYVGASVTSITNANITDCRSAVHVPLRVYLKVTNKSGGELLPGEVVVWDDSNDDAITTTSTQDDYMVAGVVADIIADDGAGRICVMGLMPVNVDGAVDVGDMLVTSSTAKQATIEGSNAIGRCLDSVAASGTVPAFLNVKAAYPAYKQAVEKGAPYSINTDTWTDIDGTNLSLTITTHGGDVDVFFRTACYNTAASTQDVGFDIDIDGTRYTVRESIAVSLGIAGISCPPHANAMVHTSALVRVTGLAPGSHTFKLQWKRTATPGNTIYIGSNNVTIFSAREVLN